MAHVADSEGRVGIRIDKCRKVDFMARLAEVKGKPGARYDAGRRVWFVSPVVAEALVATGRFIYSDGRAEGETENENGAEEAAGKVAIDVDGVTIQELKAEAKNPARSPLPKDERGRFVDYANKAELREGLTMGHMPLSAILRAFDSAAEKLGVVLRVPAHWEGNPQVREAHNRAVARVEAEKGRAAAEKVEEAETETETEDAEAGEPFALQAPKVTATPALPVPPGRASGLGAVLDAAIREAVCGALSEQGGAGVDEEAVRRLVREEFETFAPRAATLSVRIGDLPQVEISGQHELFPIALAIVAAGVPLFLVGPAGSGKSTALKNVAQALGLDFAFVNVGALTGEAKFLGFSNAMGEYIRTSCRSLYENGGVFLIDEIDAGNANVLVVLNAMISADEFGFPDGMVKKHKDFRVVAAANTYGGGADRQYVGRNQLDAATLDRFFFLPWGYDEGFEAELLGIKAERKYRPLKKSGYTPETWLARVRSVRGFIETRNGTIRHVVSPRATILGAKLLDVIDKKTLEDGLLWKGINREDRKQIETGIGG